jgi:hypothetical protein
MAFIAVNQATEFVRLEINASGEFANANAAIEQTANVLNVPALQDITVSATPGTFRWQQLDSLSELVVTTPSTNALSGTLVLDPTSFFTGANSTPGIFAITNEKRPVYFRMYWQGNSAGDRYVQGEGFITALAPTTNPGAPVWTTPFTIEVTGNYETGVV